MFVPVAVLKSPTKAPEKEKEELRVMRAASKKEESY